MKTKREKIKTACVILAMLLLFIGGVLVPYGFRDAGLQRRIDTARSQLGIDGVDNAGLVRLYDEVKDLRVQIDGRGQFIPDEDQISLVLNDFSGLINAPGVTGQEIVTVKTGQYADYNILPVKIQFNAPFATAFDLVGRIERLSSVVRIDRLNIEAEPSYPHQPLTVNLELSAFYTTQSIGGGS
jgi:Pilus assembly protein, PilO